LSYNKKKKNLEAELGKNGLVHKGGGRQTQRESMKGKRIFLKKASTNKTGGSKRGRGKKITIEKNRGKETLGRELRLENGTAEKSPKNPPKKRPPTKKINPKKKSETPTGRFAWENPIHRMRNSRTKIPNKQKKDQ